MDCNRRGASISFLIYDNVFFVSINNRLAHSLGRRLSLGLPFCIKAAPRPL